MIEQDVKWEAVALGHLCKRGSFAVSALEMKEALVMGGKGSGQTKLATLPASTVAEWVANGYLRQLAKGKVNRYEITEAGKAYAMEMDAAAGFLDRAAEREVAADLGNERPLSHTSNESPKRYAPDAPIVSMYEKQKGNHSHYRQQNWISERGFAASTRLAEDFAQAQMLGGQPTTIDWSSIDFYADLTPLHDSTPRTWFDNDSTTRFEDALKAVGSGLSDILLLFICYEYGIEQAEKALKWSSRSGKVVLHIALERLADHYAAVGDDVYCLVGEAAPSVNK